MFNIGDKIVYPTQGVGLIKGIEEKSFAGKVQNYYKIDLINTDLEILLPTNREEMSKMRLVTDEPILDGLLNNVKNIILTLQDINTLPCRQRMIANGNKIKSGSLLDFIEVVCNLTEINSTQNLNLNEKQMLQSTKKFLIEEISLSKNIDTMAAKDLLNHSLELISIH